MRLRYVDAFRGLLIAHMAFDHASMMVNAGRGGEELWAVRPPVPTDLLQFLARFTGVAVAPGFFFMAGFMVAITSAGRADRGVDQREVTRRLVTRGVVLLLTDALILGIPRLFGGFYSFVVLSSIGASLILLAFARRLPVAALLVAALAIMALHPLLDVSSLPTALRAILHEPVRSGPIRSLYPIIPWVGVVLLGFVVGSAAHDRRRWVIFGAISLALFFAIRVGNGYGNAYAHSGLGHIDFWMFAKYPPDLAWLTWSFAQVFLGLALVSWLSERVSFGPLETLGRVSFFFYVVHFYALGAMSAVVGRGHGLGAATGLWIACLALLIPLCAWYDRKKRERPNIITRYL